MIIVAAAATGPIVPAVARGGLAPLRRLAHPPVNALGRVLWTLAAVAAGVALIRFSSDIGPVLVTVAGLALAFAGVHVLASVLPDSSLPGTTAPRQRFVLAACAVGALAAPAALAYESRQTAHAGDQAFTCNGHAELCDRRVDEVTFAGAHNAMAAVDAGFLLPDQRRTIGEQLDAGVRALLLDTHYGLSTNTGVVWSDFQDTDRQDLIDEVGEETVTAMEQLRRSLLPTSESHDVYLCHGYCELGATRAVDAFTDIRQFLETHPAEVVALFLQDSTAAVDTVAALHAAGLDAFAATHEPGAPWPTLGELIRDRTPLIVFSERHGGAPDWFQRAFDETVQDTTYHAESVDQLTCAPNRGPRDASIFLLNHWIAANPPAVADAQVINAEAFLLDRARRCTKERRHPVNIIAVNFTETGDLLTVVDTLNHVGPAR